MHTKEEINLFMNKNAVPVQQVQTKKEAIMGKKQINVIQQELKLTDTDSKHPLRN